VLLIRRGRMDGYRTGFQLLDMAHQVSLLSFEEDHFGDPRLSSRERVAQDARAHNVPLPDGPIFLLTHLRYLGYCFNPISFYFCYDRSGHVDTIPAEVNSTFGESRNYWLWRKNLQSSVNSLYYRCPKTMHVSLPGTTDAASPPRPSVGSSMTKPGSYSTAPEKREPGSNCCWRTIGICRARSTSWSALRCSKPWGWTTTTLSFRPVTGC